MRHLELASASAEVFPKAIAELAAVLTLALTAGPLIGESDLR